ncbi:decarboxylase [Nocardia sp. NBC_01377]|uniref:decarboxylase n=1 Tax=Nocardia sp. NBC_01377 TaxID=2903595 RepID=UPI003245A495
MTPSAPTLPAKLHPMVRAFLDSRETVEAIVSTFGSPVHLLFPQVYSENLARLRDVLDHRVPGHRICYAHKVNQSRAFVRVAERAGISIDVASPWEWAEAVDAGFESARIEVTGPKGETFLRHLVGTGSTINVDNLWELGRIAELADAAVPVLLRISGFDGTPISRFGVPLPRMDEAFDLLRAHRDRLAFLGFAFHLDSGEQAERVRAFDVCLGLVEQAYGHGLSPSVVNIGGGLRQVFTADADRFDAYVGLLRESLLGRGAPMSWAGNMFGYHVDGAAVHGVPVFHKYANTVAADRLLDDLLTAPLDNHGGRSVAQVATDNLLTLWTEPGKALVDHAGITVARVEFTKETADGTELAHVDISRDAVTPADQEVMVDPILLPRAGDEFGSTPAEFDGTSSWRLRATADTGPVGVYIAGRLCLERDLITNHMVWLPRRPRPGDLLAFPNTAAYHMDLSAAAASRHHPPAKVAVTRRDGVFHACLDTDYEPDVTVAAERLGVPRVNGAI